MKLLLTFRGGVMRAVYSDHLRPLLKAGKATVRRASHVEPSIVNNTLWEADLAPCNGPKLIGFKTRKAALTAEVRYIERNVL